MKLDVFPVIRSQRNPDQIFDVNFRGSFQSSTESFFSFDSDFSRHAMAHSMAKEPWSRAYFEQLVKAHQNHYEQIGKDTKVKRVFFHY